MASENLSIFKIIGFTDSTPYHDVEEEVYMLVSLFDSGAIDLLHLRKPNTAKEYVRNLIERLPADLHSKIVLHSHFELAKDYNFYGVHFKEESKGVGCVNYVSRSCHYFSELTDAIIESIQYSFLSPIYDSISKEGYKANVNIYDKNAVKVLGSQKVMALGGIKPENFSELYSAKFAGAALLGYLWNYNLKIDEIVRSIVKAKHELK